MKKTRYIRIPFYGIVIAFWLAVIGLFFFIPSVYRLFAPVKEITLLTWAGVFDERVMSEFYKKTGIHVNVNYYTSNEELITLLRATQGKGYDIVVPSDYAVRILRQDNLLKKIDKKRLNFFNALDRRLMGFKVDEGNDYALPYDWEIYGLGYDTTFFPDGLPNPSWSWIFTDPGTFEITMLNDPIEVVRLAAFYLFGSIPSLNEIQLRAVRDLLVKQHGWVAAYTGSRPDYFLLTHNCPLVVTTWSSILRGLSQADHLEFVIPKEGAFISIEHLALSRATKRDNYIYAFLNFVYQDNVMRYLFDAESALPTRADVLSELSLNKDIENLLRLPREEFVRRVHFFKPLVSEEILYNLWIDVKAR